VAKSSGRIAKGFTHDLLLEAGVFLVSVKLIIMSYEQAVMADELVKRLDDVRSALERPTQVESEEHGES
jgi:hypothetical protein